MSVCMRVCGVCVRVCVCVSDQVVLFCESVRGKQGLQGKVQYLSQGEGDFRSRRPIRHKSWGEGNPTTSDGLLYFSRVAPKAQGTSVWFRSPAICHEHFGNHERGAESGKVGVMETWGLTQRTRGSDPGDLGGCVQGTRELCLAKTLLDP